MIVETADELGADLIVVGTRNGNALERLVLGSTSTKVLHHAHCDVLVVR
jgi:nucleotide-binding universal stress UspA family protein